MELYYEQYVIDDAKARNKGKKIFFTVMFALSIVFVAASALFLILTFFLPLASDGSDASANFSWAQLIIPAVVLVLSIVWLYFIRRFRARLDVDFDYILSGEQLRIIRVFNRTRRKLYLTINVKNLAAYGPVSVDSFERYDKTPGVKKRYVNITTDESKLYFMYYTDGADKSLVIFEPDETLLRDMRLAIGRDTMLKK